MRTNVAMQHQIPIATWLELAMVARCSSATKSLRMHRLEGMEDGWAALSLDGRLLHDCEGKLTVFLGADAAIRFLSLIGRPTLVDGEPIPFDISRRSRASYLGLRRRGRLATCRETEVAA